MTARHIFTLLCLAPAMAAAQGPNAAEMSRARAAMAPLARLVGTWEGDAQVVLGPGPAQVVRQREEITLGSGGTVLTVSGVARSADGPTKGNVVFQASATVWYDHAMGKLRMRARRAEGDSVEADIQLRPDSLIWGFPAQGGRIRFTIAYTATDWHEVVHFIRDGGPPIPTIEMRLKKVVK